MKALSDRGQISLSERQMAIVERMADEAITNREVRELFGISNRAALNELGKFMELGVVKKTGQGRSVRYVLA